MGCGGTLDQAYDCMHVCDMHTLWLCAKGHHMLCALCRATSCVMCCAGPPHAVRTVQGHLMRNVLRAWFRAAMRERKGVGEGSRHFSAPGACWPALHAKVKSRQYLAWLPLPRAHTLAASSNGNPLRMHLCRTCHPHYSYNSVYSTRNNLHFTHSTDTHPSHVLVLKRSSCWRHCLHVVPCMQTLDT